MEEKFLWEQTRIQQILWFNRKRYFEPVLIWNEMREKIMIDLLEQRLWENLSENERDGKSTSYVFPTAPSPTTTNLHANICPAILVRERERE